MNALPDAIRADWRKARRLEIWTLAWIGSIVAIMYYAMGSSQAMKSAIFEDLLSLVPAIVWLVAAHFEKKAPDARFPYGFHRAQSLAFLIAATALASVGAFLLYESAMTLLKPEHPPLGAVHPFGIEPGIWSGWLMIGALAYSIVPPVILGRMKLPVARRIRDKVLHTDAMMQKADWQTGATGIAGIVGLGLGYWWADAAAAAIISFSILADGIKGLRTAAAELVDGAPRELGGDAISQHAAELAGHYRIAYPDATIRTRETGRFIKLEVHGARPEDARAPLPDIRDDWRIDDIAFVPGCDEGSSG